MLTRELLASYIDAGAGRIKADMAVMGGTLINVNTGEYYQADVAIYKGKITAVEKDISDYVDDHTKIIDAKGKYLAPGLIDCHVHVECSKMSMTRFAEAVVPHGTTSIVSGLDEYISVIGVDGKDHERYHQDSRCYGIWELVREAVMTKDQDTLDAIVEAEKRHRPIFGCSPLARGKDLNEYLMSGVRVDHESYDHEEFLEKARKGIHTIIRESAVTKFLNENVRAITECCPGMARHTSFCSDDVHARGILAHGHIDHIVRLAIKAGVAPMTAIQMGTINAAEAYQIDDHVGSITPGKDADILLVDQPGTFQVETVISKGQLITEKGEDRFDYQIPARQSSLTDTVKHALLTADDFATHVNIEEGTALVETIHSVGPFMRKRRDVELEVKDGIVCPSAEKDVAMVSVIERYGIHGHMSKGFISGWSFNKGAIATTASPDDNNLVVAGASCEDMALAANTLIGQGGGQVVVIDGKIISFLPLPIAGIASDLAPEELAKKEIELEEGAKEIGSSLPDPIFYLSFLPITAIPDLAITDGGCVDYTKLRYFDPILEVKEN